MTDYRAPLRDIRFARNEVLGYPEHYANLPNADDLDPEVLDAILEEMAKFSQEELGPLYQVGDEQGCTLNDDHSVTTPKGFKEAYQLYVESGWPTMAAPVEFGGQGLPESLALALTEMTATANWAWHMYPGLSHGAKHTLISHGSTDQKKVFLEPLVQGNWTGTMCLTESQAGSDLGLLNTKAEPNDDGSYAITGSKIFISSGEHDMSDNIVHIVLARLPDAPAGTRGISLFIVPKYLPAEDGSLGERNTVTVGSLEHKMGIHGNATCVMNFDNATGFLIGEANHGLQYMFTFMNTARIGTAQQGVAHAERAFQGGIEYARDRLQMRSISGVKNPDAAADPIIVHPDVRRMLLTSKAIAEGGRMLIFYMAKLSDLLDVLEDGDEKTDVTYQFELLTPIAKAFLTETGFEVANLGMQIYGGHGFIREWGMEQNVRDSRIASLYEGTTGIQALDLIGRKVLGSGGEMLKRFTKVIHEFCKENEGDEVIGQYVEELSRLNKEWGTVTMEIGAKAAENPDEAGAAAVDYLMFSGYVCLGYFWALAAKAASDALKAGTGEENFYQAKLQTADFYFKRLLPRTATHLLAIRAGGECLMAMDADNFDLGY